MDAEFQSVQLVLPRLSILFAFAMHVAFRLLWLLPLGAAVPLSRPAARPAAPARVLVPVELFTSEGCSSCPAADALLRELTAAQPVPGVEILALGEHVDYWNRLGWQDAFSQPAFTQRQHMYAEGFGSGSYTPQAVVGGRTELVGHQREKLLAAIREAARAPQATVCLTAEAAGSTHRLQVRVSGAPAAGAQVLLAITESGLASQVGRGENAGRLLRHAAVVRELRPLGTATAAGTFAATVPVNVNSGWKTAGLRYVVLVQAPATHYITGAAALPAE